MEIKSLIEVTVDYEPDNWTPKQFHFNWNGPEDGVLGVSGELMKLASDDVLKRPENPTIGDTITFGPYELVIIKHQVEPEEIYYCIRKEFAVTE